ncbi:MAG: PTS sugar transporter subunit IIC [Elusimicrobiota bacterium]|jgi:mannose/fructose/N-acetylgalactosamine-specific phosphotransferase system component IIC
MSWLFLTLPAASIGAALVELDDTCIGQWMLSRPIIVGPLFGAVLGSVWSGVAFGALFEAFSCEHSPVGGFLSFNGCVSAVCAVLLSAGPAALPWPADFPAALGIGLFHARWMEPFVRGLRASIIQEMESDLMGTSPIPWQRHLARSLLPHAAATAALVYCACAAGSLLGWAWGVFPEILKDGLSRSFGWSLWLGWALLLDSLWRRS